MLNWFRGNFQKIIKRKLGKERGQSLVEMAFIVPILIFIFLGLIEVGWAIRSYLILLSTGRETTRYASRGETLDFSGIFEGADATDTERIKADVRYNRVLTHTNNLLAINDLGMDLGIAAPDDANGTLILSHVLVDTGYPCYLDPTDPTDTCSDVGQCADPDGNGICDCSSVDEREPDNTDDDLVLHPNRYGYSHFRYTAGTITATTQIDWPVRLTTLKEENDALNCLALKRDRNVEMSVNSVIVVETFFEQNQLLGVPVISNALTDPVSMYSNTVMRITSSSLSQGEACELVPIGISIDPPGPDTTYVTDSSYVLAMTSDVRWLRWTDGGQNLDYFVNALTNRRLSVNGFQSGADTVLNKLDTVQPLNVTFNETSPGISEAFDSLKGRTLTFPLLNGLTVMGFADLVLTDFTWPNIVEPNGVMVLQFKKVNEACPVENVTSWETP